MHLTHHGIQLSGGSGRKMSTGGRDSYCHIHATNVYKRKV